MNCFLEEKSKTLTDNLTQSLSIWLSDPNVLQRFSRALHLSFYGYFSLPRYFSYLRVFSISFHDTVSLFFLAFSSRIFPNKTYECAELQSPTDPFHTVFVFCFLNSKKSLISRILCNFQIIYYLLPEMDFWIEIQNSKNGIVQISHDVIFR